MTRGDAYQKHTKCISEDEKYGGKDYKPKPNANKGERKQEEWTEVCTKNYTIYPDILKHRKGINYLRLCVIKQFKPSVSTRFSCSHIPLVNKSTAFSVIRALQLVPLLAYLDFHLYLNVIYCIGTNLG